MLKKEQALKGAVVEVFQIKKGVPGADTGPSSQYVLITAGAGTALSGGKGVTVGTRLEIVEPPKRRGGINTAVVKVLDSDEDIVGHVYWCELRASCRLVTASPDTPSTPPPPARKPSGKLKAFSEKQLARLPRLGYWVVLYNGRPYDFICVKNGAVKYTRPGHEEWHTLLWSCCPTAKQVAADPDKHLYFADHASMLARFPDAEGAACMPAPND
ncbi:MAG: hypothetical protein AB7W16_17610 [Candidatus Obscuribacterales bacterium]